MQVGEGAEKCRQGHLVEQQPYAQRVVAGGAVLVVSDYMGKEVQRREGIPAGASSQQLDLTGQASGLYLIRLITHGKTLTQRLVLQ